MMPQGNNVVLKESELFEHDVHRIASALFPGDPYGGPTIRDGRERDGVYVTEDSVVAIEATMLRTKAKAEEDGRKLKALTDSLQRQHPYKAVKGYFITSSEPTADQVDAIRRVGAPVAIISFARFKARLIDSRQYLQVRDVMAFGSARDPETDAIEVSDKYVPLKFVDASDSSQLVDQTDVVQLMNAGTVITLIGDFGTGKSMTLREVYKDLQRAHIKNAAQKFCIHLNLNNHQGQSDPSEALIRHANSVGFDRPAQLVRAWRSGEAHLILD